MGKTAIHIGVFDDSDIWMKAAIKLGYRIIATHPMDISSKYYYDKVKDLISEFHIVSYMDTDKLIQIAKDNNVTLNITHPCTNDATYAIGNVNSALGLKGISADNAKIAASKWEWHNFLTEYNFPKAKWCFKYDDIEDLETIEYPCIVKPNFGAGSAGVKKIYSSQELKEFMETKDPNNGWHLNKNYDYYVVQEYNRAKYFLGVNAAVHNGKLIIFGHSVRNLYSLSEQFRQPYFYYEDYMFFERNDGYVSGLNYNLIQDLIDKLKLNNTAIKFDILLDEEKNIISFSDGHLRPGSSNSATGYHKLFGYDVTEQLVKLNTDLEPKFERIYETKWKYLYCKNYRFSPGKIRSIKFPEPDEHVHHFSTFLKPGSEIPKYWNASVANMCGQLLLLGETKEQLFQKLDEFTRNIEIEYE